MIRITNQEEFKKCCEMCNSIDIESRYLGISLMDECVEYLNCGKLHVKIEYFDKSVDMYEWNKFIEIGINNQYYKKFGDDLFHLIFRGCYTTSKGFRLRLIENDQSNESRRI